MRRRERERGGGGGGEREQVEIQRRRGPGEGGWKLQTRQTSATSFWWSECVDVDRTRLLRNCDGIDGGRVAGGEGGGGQRGMGVGWRGGGREIGGGFSRLRLRLTRLM